jgi:hypothetical protein
MMVGSGDRVTWAFNSSGSSWDAELITTQVFRDPSAWYHFLCVADTTQATASNRLKLYVNGTQVTTFSTATYPSQNTDLPINSTQLHQIGRNGVPSNYFSGYLADIHFIDGQALDPTSFGEFDATTGVWNPKAYTGTYGTNGFHLDFADNASTTTIGYDAAGSNDWTANNLSVTAGAGNDSLVDVPTNGAETDTGVGGEVRGNYCVLNALNQTGGLTLSNGNLDITATLSDKAIFGTLAIPTSGKWYFEATQGAFGGNFFRMYIGVKPQPIGSSGGAIAVCKADNVQLFNTSGTAYTWSTTFAEGDILGLAVDSDANTATFYKNGSAFGTAMTLTAGQVLFPSFGTGNANVSVVANFGQRAFAYTAPSGFKALNTANLPAPVVTKPSDVMDVKLYTGNGSTQTISGLGFSPNLVWIKGRSGATDHALYDTVRGVQQQLESNTTTDETTESTGLTAFNSDGFALGALAQANTSSATYAAWCWDESVSAGFDIVTYTGNGSARTIAHSLGVAPSMIIVKARTTASTDQGWPVYHSANTAAPATDYLLLNSSVATADLDTVWNDTAPTSSVFSVGTNALVNANADTYVAYCFAPVAGYSSFGSYTGNGSADGPFVYTGFRPRWVMIKRTDSTEQWYINDAARDTYNVTGQSLRAQSSGAEATIGGANSATWDILSSGFKPRNSGAGTNASGGTYIYAAFAEHPFQFSRAR